MRNTKRILAILLSLCMIAPGMGVEASAVTPPEAVEAVYTEPSDSDTEIIEQAPQEEAAEVVEVADPIQENKSLESDSVDEVEESIEPEISTIPEETKEPIQEEPQTDDEDVSSYELAEVSNLHLAGGSDDTNNDGYHDGDKNVIDDLINYHGLNREAVFWNSDTPKRVNEINMTKGWSSYASIYGDVNLSSLTKLSTVVLYGRDKDWEDETRLDSLNLSGLQNLTKVEIHAYGSLDSLNISNLPKLTSFFLFHGKIYSLSFDESTTNLEEIEFERCPNLSSVSFASEMSNLKTFACSDMQYKSGEGLKISDSFIEKMPNVTRLQLDTDRLPNLDFNKVKKISEYLEIATLSPNFTSMDISMLDQLPNLQVYAKYLTDVKLPETSNKLTKIYMYCDSLESINISNLPVLEEVELSNNKKLSSLTYGNNPKLTELSLSGSAIKSLDLNPISSTKKLYLDIYGTSISSLDLSPLENCEDFFLRAGNTSISSLNLSNLKACKKLGLELYNMPIDSLDFSGLTNCTLGRITLSGTKISSLDISNLKFGIGSEISGQSARDSTTVLNSVKMPGGKIIKCINPANGIMGIYSIRYSSGYSDDRIFYYFNARHNGNAGEAAWFFNGTTKALDSSYFYYDSYEKASYANSGLYDLEKESSDVSVSVVFSGTSKEPDYNSDPNYIYNVTYILNGGANHKSNSTSYNNSWSPTIHPPTREGYTFDGWYDNSGFTGSKITQIPIGNTKDITLYAKWIKNDSFNAEDNTPYTIKFNSNGGKGTVKSQTVKYSQSVKLNANKFTKKGYTFVGWSKKKNGSVDYKDKATVSKLKKSGTITLYAKWVKNTQSFKIKYSLGAKGAKNNKKNPTKYKVTTKTIKLKNPTCKGKKFVGWYTKKKGGTKVTKISKGSYGNKTLYARWK